MKRSSYRGGQSLSFVGGYVFVVRSRGKAVKHALLSPVLLKELVVDGVVRFVGEIPPHADRVEVDADVCRLLAFTDYYQRSAFQLTEGLVGEQEVCCGGTLPEGNDHIPSADRRVEGRAAWRFAGTLINSAVSMASLRSSLPEIATWHSQTGTGYAARTGRVGSDGAQRLSVASSSSRASLCGLRIA